MCSEVELNRRSTWKTDVLKVIPKESEINICPACGNKEILCC